MRSGTLGVLLFLAWEGLIFHTHFYERYLEPESAAARTSLHLRWLRENPPPAGWKQIAVIGDSRIAEGFSGRIASEAPGAAQNYFWCFGLHATTPRIWYYFLREADPARDRFSAIVFALDRYTDQDSYDPFSDRLIDLNFAIYQLRLGDAWEFSRSMRSPDKQRTAFFGAIFKGWTLRRDVQEFLPNIPARLKSAELARTNGYGFEWGYTGVQTDVRGLTADPATNTLRFPPGFSDLQRTTIQATITPVFAPYTADMTRYRTLWFNKIISHFRRTKTKLIFFQLPRAPLHPLYPPFPSPFIDSIRNKPNVIVLPAETFEDLETPENFFDGLHMNRTGRELFSRRLAAIVDKELALP